MHLTQEQQNIIKELTKEVFGKEASERLFG